MVRTRTRDKRQETRQWNMKSWSTYSSKISLAWIYIFCSSKVFFRPDTPTSFFLIRVVFAFNPLVTLLHHHINTHTQICVYICVCVYIYTYILGRVPRQREWDTCPARIQKANEWHYSWRFGRQHVRETEEGREREKAKKELEDKGRRREGERDGKKVNIEQTLHRRLTHFFL